MNTDSSGTLTYEYDELNRVKRVVIDKDIEILYEYDMAGNVIKICRNII